MVFHFINGNFTFKKKPKEIRRKTPSIAMFNTVVAELKTQRISLGWQVLGRGSSIFKCETLLSLTKINYNQCIFLLSLIKSELETEKKNNEHIMLRAT